MEWGEPGRKGCAAKDRVENQMLRQVRRLSAPTRWNASSLV